MSLILYPIFDCPRESFVRLVRATHREVHHLPMVCPVFSRVGLFCPPMHAYPKTLQNKIKMK